MNNLWTRVIPTLLHIGADPRDEDDIRIQKSLLVGSSIMFTFAGASWGVMYIALGFPTSATIPLMYAVVSVLSIILFGLTRRYYFFRFSQLVLVLLLPFLLMLSLGGFVNSSGVILWSLTCPMGAIFFDKPKRATRWFIAFLTLLILSSVLQPYFPAPQPMPTHVITLFFVLNISGVSAGVFVLLRYFVGQKDLLQERADNLLLNILPKEIAKILKKESRTVAEHFGEASILFADIVNFTPLSAKMTPIELVELLNAIFSHFDLLVERYDLEKIKTIGDCYMVAAGVPRPRADHAQALIQIALEMQDYVLRHEINGHQLNFRIGINSGPVVAGVIGRKKFIYDLWGDAVNTASRMEAHGAAGIIQITRATFQLVQDQFVCETRGVIQVKGKGEMEVWAVTGEKEKSQPILSP